MSALEHLGDELSAYLDGELGAEARAKVDAHLGECAACAQRLEELAAVDTFSRALPAPAPEGYFEAFPARVRQRLLARRVRRFPAWTWAAAAAVLLAVVTPLTLQRERAPSPAQVEPAREGFSRRAEPAAPVAEPTPAPPSTLTAEQLDRLRALGYVEGSRARSMEEQLEIQKKQDAVVRQRLRERDADDAGQKRAAVGGVVGGLPGGAAGASPRDAELKDGRRKEEAYAFGYGTDKMNQNVPAPAAPPPTTVPESMAENRQWIARGDEASAKTRAEPAAAPPPAEQPRAQTEAAKPGPAQDALRAARMTGPAAKTVSPDEAGMAQEFEAQASRPVRTAEEAREAARRWQELADRQPQTRLADEARLRAIEALAMAFRLERKQDDRDRARKAAAAYLAGSGAHKERVRALLDQLGR